jgi:CBS domain-containing protein
MYRNIVNTDAAIGIFVEAERDRIMIIGRSKNEDLNIGKIMRVLGGGGHPAAGSALLRLVNPDTVIETVTELIRGDQQGSILVADIMSFPVFSISQDSTMEELSRILVEKGCTGMPVVNAEGSMVGVVSKRDFRKVKKIAQMQSPVKAFMRPNLVPITPEKSVMEAARIMVKYDIGRLPVMQDGKIIGIVSRSDMMNYFYDMLPD